MKSVEETNVVPTKIKSLLDEFKEIIANDLPKGFPPVRIISHQIDLMLGLSLPNKEPYGMTSAKSEEVNRQVQELLDRGLIRENLSPCVVLAMLPQRKHGNEECVLTRVL